MANAVEKISVAALRGPDDDHDMVAHLLRLAPDNDSEALAALRRRFSDRPLCERVNAVAVWRRR